MASVYEENNGDEEPDGQEEGGAEEEADIRSETPKLRAPDEYGGGGYEQSGIEYGSEDDAHVDHVVDHEGGDGGEDKEG